MEDEIRKAMARLLDQAQPVNRQGKLERNGIPVVAAFTTDPNLPTGISIYSSIVRVDCTSPLLCLTAHYLASHAGQIGWETLRLLLQCLRAPGNAAIRLGSNALEPRGCGNVQDRLERIQSISEEISNDIELAEPWFVAWEEPMEEDRTMASIHIQYADGWCDMFPGLSVLTAILSARFSGPEMWFGMMDVSPEVRKTYILPIEAMWEEVGQPINEKEDDLILY